jgi:outer membrane protein assembly factor BamB
MLNNKFVKVSLCLSIVFSLIGCSSFSSLYNKQSNEISNSNENESDEVSFKFSAVRSYKRKLLPMWFKNLDPEYQTGNLPIALNSPLIHEGLIFIGKNDGHMKAFDSLTGRLIWDKFDKGDYHSAPVAFGKHIIYGTGEGRIYARNYMTGKIKYAVDLDASVESKPVIYKGKLFVHLRNHKLFCLDARTGKIIWAYKRSVPYLTTLQRVSTPLVRRDKVYVGFADGYIASFSAEDGVLLWEKKLASGTKFVDVDVTPVIQGKTLFVNSLTNQLSLLDSATGALKRRMPYTPSRAPLFTKKGIILGTIHGELISLDRHYQEIKKIKIADGPISSIVPWKKYFIVTSASQLVKVVHQKTFKISETFDLGHVSSAVFGDIVSKDGILAFMSSRSRLYVFK